MDRLGGKGGYLPLILPLASAVGSCLSRYRRWDTVVHPQNRGDFLPATATLMLHVEPGRIPLVIGGDVIRQFMKKNTSWPQLMEQGNS
jgi:hypothetical protein